MSLVDALLGPPKPDKVVERYGPQVYRHLKRIFGPQADVDDVYQGVFVEVLRSLPTFQGRSQLSTWIRRITWNVAYQEMRGQYRQRRHTELDEAHSPHPGASPHEAAVQRQELHWLYEALESLDPRQRAAVIMHDIEGKTLKQVSKELGRPLQTVASQVYAGREKLGRTLRRRGVGEVASGEVATGDLATGEVATGEVATGEAASLGADRGGRRS